MGEGTRVIPTGCAHNCGGRCPLNVHLEGGRVVRVEGDRRPDVPSQPQLRACARGRAYRRLFDHPDRLKVPLKRVGPRGQGRFEPIGWREAVELIAGEIDRIGGAFGNQAIFVMYGTGFGGLLNGPASLRRLLSLVGGHLDFYSNYSSGQYHAGTEYTIGTGLTGHDRRDYVNTKLFLLWGWNPAETVFGTNTMYYLWRARERGARFICIDPRYTDTAAVLADWHIPIRPGTDNALMDAMAHVIFSEGLEDRQFLDRLCLGHDDEHMPREIPAGESYQSWVLGEADGVPRSPGWAEDITGVPADDIVRLAREYAAVKPASLIMGYGPQRHILGEQPPRGAIQLAALTGNIGVPGGGAGGNYARLPRIPGLPPAGDNPVTARISAFMWSEAVRRGHSLSPEDGLRGARGLESGIKLLFAFQSNMLINQHADINQVGDLLRDESLCEFIAVSDLFVTPSAKFADIILPSSSPWEKEDILHPWSWGDYLIYCNRIRAPESERRSDYQWCALLAGALGVGRRFTEGRTEREWLETLYEEGRNLYPGLPSFEEFRREGVAVIPDLAPHIPLAREVSDPKRHPFPTPSGKIEFFSRRLYEMGRPREIPATARYNPSPEGVEDGLRRRYPLQLLTCHIKSRTHSMFDNVDWTEELDPQRLRINPIDAEERGIQDGDPLRVFNDRGETRITAQVTPRIMPGVVDLPQGAWFSPSGPAGADAAGCANVLTWLQPSALARMNPHHTALVQVERVEERQP